VECQDGLHNCSQVCIEIQGGFTCSCYGGYELSKDGVSCKGIVITYTYGICLYKNVIIRIYPNLHYLMYGTAHMQLTPKQE